MRMFIMVVAFALSSCASVPKQQQQQQQQECPPIPQMGTTEQLKDYTLRIIDLYGQCARLKDSP